MKIIINFQNDVNFDHILLNHLTINLKYELFCEISPYVGQLLIVKNFPNKIH